MTDAEVKRVLTKHHPLCVRKPPCEVCEALRHALRAIEDRAALVTAARADSNVWQQGPDGVLSTALDAARRHMRGEE